MAGQKHAVAFAVAICALGSTSGAQVSYVSQERTVVAATSAFAASDFGPFVQTASWSTPPFVCSPSGGSGESASATQESTVNPGGIAFALTATSRMISSNDVASRLAVTFTVPGGSLYTLAGQRTFGINRSWSSAGGDATLTLTGPGLAIDLPHGGDTRQTLPFSASGTFQGGTYTLDVDVTSIHGWCSGGSPETGSANAHGTLAITLARCRADWDHDGAVQPADVGSFVASWLESVTFGTLAADFDGNAAVEPADVASFVQAWFDALTNGPC